MPELISLFLLLLAGAFGGFLSGVLGVGGGIIFIPILDLVLKQYGVEEEIVKFILANSLAVIVFTGAFNSWRQYKAGNFFPKLILYTAVPGVISVLLGSWLVTQGTWYSKNVFNLAFAALIIPAVLRMVSGRNDIPNLKSEIPLVKFKIVGAITGVFTAFTGLGGGLIMIPAFVNMLKLEMKKAVSVSAGVVPFFALPTTIYYMFQSPLQSDLPIHNIGFLLYPIVIPMIIGTMITVPLGVKMGHKLAPKTAKLIFAIFVGLVLLKMLWETFS